MKLRIEKMAPWLRIFALKAPGPVFESLATTSQAQYDCMSTAQH